MKEERLTRQEIESRIQGMGDYVVMDYLAGCLRKSIDFDTKKFVMVKLAGFYEARKMYVDAGKLMINAAEINTTFQNKINDFVKACELFIKGGDFDLCDVAMRKALSLSSEKQKGEINRGVKEFYKTQARGLLDKDKRHNALMVYERLFRMDLNVEERENVREKLLHLYERLGKIKEYRDLIGKKY